MSDFITIPVLAIIQGLAELLPVSRSAHVIRAGKLLELDPAEPRFVFLLILLHTGTMFAAIVYFWSDWKALLLPAPGKGQDPPAGGGWHFLKMIVVATVMTGILGLGLQFLIENIVLEKLLHHEKR